MMNFFNTDKPEDFAGSVLDHHYKVNITIELPHEFSVFPAYKKVMFTVL